MLFKKEYYQQVLLPNVDEEALNNPFNKEIFAKKKISDIELVYNMKKKDIKLPPTDHSAVNRLYKNMKPEEHEMFGTMNEDEAMFFERTRQAALANVAAEHGQSSASGDEQQANEHYNSSEDD